MTNLLRLISKAILIPALVFSPSMTSQVLAVEGVPAADADESYDAYYKILPPNKLAKNGAKSLAVRLDMTDPNNQKFALQGLDGKKVLWSKSVDFSDNSSAIQRIEAETVGTNHLKISAFVHYQAIFYTLMWDGKKLKVLSAKADETEGANLKALYDSIAAGKLEPQAYYTYVGENFDCIWRWTNRKEVAAMIKRADATAMSEYHRGRLDKAIARESAALSAASDIISRILSGTESTSVDDTDTETIDKLSPLHWLKVFQKAYTKPDPAGDKQSNFLPSDYLTAVNNYAFFLQLKGEHGKAIPIFQKIVSIDPERSVNYLNLGDSLFAVGAKKEALAAYNSYEQHLDKRTIIPERVIQRLKGNL